MKKILIVIAVLVVAAGAWFLFAPSEESRVRKAFSEVAAAIEKSGAESAFDALAKARSLAALAEPKCEFEMAGRKFVLSQERSDVTSRIVAVRNMASRIHVAFEDISVSFTNDDTAETVCDFFYQGDDFGLSVRDACSLEATLRKDPESGKWRFSRIHVVNIIEK